MRRACAETICFVLALLLGACAQTPQTPAPPLEDPTQSRAAQAQRELRDQVLALLDSEVDADAAAALPPEAAVVLVQVVNDAAHRDRRRLRALRLLGRVGDEEASRYLRGFLQPGAVPVKYRAVAAMALARRDGPAAAADLAPLLDDPAPQLREAAARALAYAGGERARTALEERVSKEPDPELRQVLQQMLTRMHP